MASDSSLLRAWEPGTCPPPAGRVCRGRTGRGGPQGWALTSVPGPAWPVMAAPGARGRATSTCKEGTREDAGRAVSAALRSRR